MTDRNVLPADAELEAELRALGRSLVLPVPSENVDPILARMDQLPAPTRTSGLRAVDDALRATGSWLRRRWRTATAVLVGLLLVLLAVTPAGAKVREWLGFGGVVVVQEPGAAGLESSSQLPSIGPLPGEVPMTLEQARSSIDFPVGISGALPDPVAVTVSGDRRVVSMFWPAEESAPAGIRLDQLAGDTDPYYVKKFFEEIQFTMVGTADALWLSRPHPIVVRAPDGTERTESARTSGPALVWQQSGVTLRLEGVDERQRAVAIAETVRF
jgi:hypothetical protein